MERHGDHRGARIDHRQVCRSARQRFSHRSPELAECKVMVALWRKEVGVGVRRVAPRQSVCLCGFVEDSDATTQPT
eukprot:CAMPEP_0175829996 /NCGR_PEP_ID=MMETSP0107_2-20121207/13678_1 /TAXON_ID=195067 ORGANISM="Goniomonas pacifica, Strain CCMP1869" /NCGR_SAMPLE_ID=MMETSP0107_2 /ASSEMBLY_ACC=CAM_ASM_000203 /LENGTH=75 /DNA_ID=CAMNT_0017142903 /DNA_START=298 /DNA_END=525 /DNA_ORIENTATION=+